MPSLRKNWLKRKLRQQRLVFGSSSSSSSSFIIISVNEMLINPEYKLQEEKKGEKLGYNYLDVLAHRRSADQQNLVNITTELQK
jgi:hypothetical protein